MLTAIRKGVAKDDDLKADLQDGEIRIDTLTANARTIRDEINTSLSAATMREMSTMMFRQFIGFSEMPFDRKLSLVHRYIQKITVTKIEDELELHFVVKPGMPEMRVPLDPFDGSGAKCSGGPSRSGSKRSRSNFKGRSISSSSFNNPPHLPARPADRRLRFRGYVAPRRIALPQPEP